MTSTPQASALEPHPLVRLLEKPAADFTAADLVRAAEELELRQVNLRYVGGSGRLKTIAFPINSREHLEGVLTRGERVDGSSIFEGTEAATSDVYIVPRHRTAFLNPFGVRQSLDLLCSFYDEDGEPLAYAQDQIVRRAAEALTRETGMSLEAFGELEYYLVGDVDVNFPVEEERGYQESAPFSKGQRVREEVLGHLSSMGVQLKYAHGEVGNIREPDRQLVQHEIEFWPVPVADAADALVLAKWVVREVAHAAGLEATFAPSVSAEGAGSGLHVHSRLVRDGANVVVDPQEGLTDTGRRLIAGYLSASKALTAFGNTVSTSYLRFAEGGESPEGICWGETDRTGLVRVPLAWVGGVLPRMVAHANPGSGPVPEPPVHPQTVELRLGDGSADVHLLLAGMAVAARRGLTNPDSLKVAERLSSEDHSTFEQLPSSCRESADELERERELFEAEDVFPASLIDAVLERLRDDQDGSLVKKAGKSDDARAELVRRHWHVG